MLTGIRFGDRPIQLSGAELVRRLVLNNQVMLGSVNAAPAHFHAAVNDLTYALARWGDLVSELIMCTRISNARSSIMDRMR